MKQLLESFQAMMGRMSPRERRLFSVLVGSIVGVIAAGVYLAGSAVFGSIQDDIDGARAALAEMRQVAPRYVELSEEKRRVEDAIRANKVSVRVAANELLRKMEFGDEIPGATGNKLSDIVSFEGKTTDTPLDIARGKAKKAVTKKGKETGGFFEIEQTLEFREVPIASVMAFLDTIESSKELLYVTKIDMARKFNNMSHARAVLGIATFQYQGDEPIAAPAPEAAGNE